MRNNSIFLLMRLLMHKKDLQIKTKQGQHIRVNDKVTQKEPPAQPITPPRHQDHEIDKGTPSRPTYTSHLRK